ncbi:hypothetical protein N7478_013078 [Penicillium angulare]|uniref:uncharacterized protein n=1 Tax=Penicillium angulare TaxID=116970 RepID=UPI00253F7292|nr:uncharacterized protein N7478_013078 [Penicillium angulare]KAJ5256974.1 hypothetical protein N7478_013078 [Penicillium angulare]
MHTPPEEMRQARYRFRPGKSCQHNVVVRYFAGDELLLCDDCGRSNRFLYVCAADTPNFSPFDDGDSVPFPDLSTLSPSVQQAAKEEHYAEDQIHRLIAQRMGALTTARDQHKESSQSHEFLLFFSMDSQISADTSSVIASATTTSTEGLSGSDDIDTNRMPCQRRSCAACRPNWADRAWESIDAIVNQEYQEPPRIPEYLNRRPVDVRVARNLPEMDVYDWKNSTAFRLWWDGFRRPLPYNMSMALGIAQSMDLGPSQFKKLMEWFINRCPTAERAKETFSWLWKIQKTPSQVAHFLQTLADSRALPQQQEWPRSTRQPLDPYDSVISRPIWEEVEQQGKLIEIPDWEYSDDLSYSAMYRPVQLRNTGLFSANRAALADLQHDKDKPEPNQSALDSNFKRAAE